MTAHAQSTIYPLWAQIPDVAENIAAQDRFTRALRLRGIKAPKPVLIEPSPSPRTPELYRMAIAASPFDPPDRTLKAYHAAVTEALLHGGAGLTRDEIVNLFFGQAAAILRASSTPTTNATQKNSLQDAKRACLRAVVFGLDHIPTSQSDNPLLRELSAQAITEVQSRPRADISIHARQTASVFIDGQIYPFPAQARNLPYGEHLIHVEEPGFAPWSLLVIVSEPNFQVDPPRNLLLRFPASEAAQIARSQNAAFALLAQLRLGEQVAIDLSLINAGTGEIRASVSVPAGGEEDSLIAAILRLDEEASHALLQVNQSENKIFPLNASLPPTKTPTPPSFQENPTGWARTHWPLLTAIGTAVGGAIVLGILVTTENDSSARP
jgi:hypothetical protein